MKRLLSLLFLFILLITSGCNNSDFLDTQKYRMDCDSGENSACAKYLFLSAYDILEKDSFASNVSKQNFSYWKARYLNKIENEKDAYIAINSMVESIDDPYTRFLNPEEFQDQNMNIDAKISGIGVVITSIDGKIMVVEVLENTPADRAGIKTGDVIVNINGTPTSGFDSRAAANLIRGKEDTTVALMILRDKKTFTLNLLRKEVKLKAVKEKMLNDDILYIKINTFMSNQTSSELIYAIRKHKDAKKIIIDLRGNHGGLLQNALQIANVFLKKGPIVSVVQKNKQKQTILADKLSKVVEVPLVVLVNGSSASASEILAAALKENDRAVLVGEKTFGKGLIQRVVNLPMDTGINVTIAKYLTPQGNDINKNGIVPNVEIKNPKIIKSEEEDIQLKKAIEVVNSI